MQITSVLVGGIERVPKAMLRNFSLEFSIQDHMGKANLEILADPESFPQVGTAAAGSAVLGGALVPGQAIVIAGKEGAGAPATVFSGTVGMVQPKLIRGGVAGAKRTNYVLTCQDNSAILDTAIIADQRDYTDTMDSAIIQDLFSRYAPSINSTTLVASIAIVPSVSWNGVPLRQALNDIIGLTGGQYFVNTSKQLVYQSPQYNPAPFSVSETPDFISSFYAERESFQYQTDMRTPANRVKVVGMINPGGATSITYTADDAASQATYGIMTRVIVDRGIVTQGQAIARANVELNLWSNPTITGTLVIRKFGLQVGQLLTVNLPSTLGVVGSFLINSVKASWDGITFTKYEVTFGNDFRPDLYRAFRALNLATKQTVNPPRTVPVDSSVNSTHFASTIQPVHIVNTLSSGAITPPPADWGQNPQVLLTTDLKLYTWNGTSWNTIVGPNSITSTEIADNAVTTPKLIANAVAAGKVDVDAITAGTIAVGAIRASDGVFATQAIQSADIGNAQIGGIHIGAGQITGPKILAAEIINSHILGGSLNGDRFSNLTITGTKMANGTVTGLQIGLGTVADSNIVNGTITGSSISAVTITGSNIANTTITGGNIVNATITSANIISVAAEKILAGTLGVATCSVSGDCTATNFRSGSPSTIFIAGGFGTTALTCTTGAFGGAVTCASVTPSNGVTGTITYLKTTGGATGTITLTKGIVTAFT